MKVKNRSQGIGPMVMAVVIVALLIVVGATFILLKKDDQGGGGIYGAATPIVAFQNWTNAYNKNDGQGMINNSTLHFAPASAQNAIALWNGTMASTIIYENLTKLSNNDIPDGKKAFIERELASLKNQSILLEYDRYCVLSYDLNISYDGIIYPWWQTHCVVVEVEGRWYRTFIEMDYGWWYNDLWQYDWFQPNTITYQATLNDSGVWSMVFLSCPSDLPLRNLTLSMSWDIPSEDNSSYYRYRVFGSAYGSGEDAPAVHERMTPDEIDNATTYYIGFIDVTGDGMLSIGDHFYIVMDQSSGDNSRLPSGTIVTFGVWKWNTPPESETYVTSGMFMS